MVVKIVPNEHDDLPPRSWSEIRLAALCSAVSQVDLPGDFRTS